MMLNQSDTEAKKCLLSSSQTKTGGLFVLKYISHRYKWIDLPETETVFLCSGTIETAPPLKNFAYIFFCAIKYFITVSTEPVTLYLTNISFLKGSVFISSFTMSVAESFFI